MVACAVSTMRRDAQDFDIFILIVYQALIFLMLS